MHIFSHGERNEQQLLAEACDPGHPTVPDDNPGRLDRPTAPVAAPALRFGLVRQISVERGVGHCGLHEHG